MNKQLIFQLKKYADEKNIERTVQYLIEAFNSESHNLIKMLLLGNIFGEPLHYKFEATDLVFLKNVLCRAFDELLIENKEKAKKFNNLLSN